ncbi:MAG: hypothetical protein HRU00_17195 [Myxococcales bacterium]|nr:hypothetical protein [Myxococcales bacterium]
MGFRCLNRGNDLDGIEVGTIDKRDDEGWNFHPSIDGGLCSFYVETNGR